MPKLLKEYRHILVLLVAVVVVVAGLLFWRLTSSKDTSNAESNCIKYLSEKICDSDFSGLSTSAAYKKAQRYNLTPKIRSENGNKKVLNTDLGGKRIYFTINNGVVTKTEFQ